MPLYAHARIEDPDEPGRYYERGAEVPETVAEGLDCVSEEQYDPASDEVPAPDVIEIDGVRYTKETTTDA